MANARDDERREFDMANAGDDEQREFDIFWSESTVGSDAAMF
jgi:hypothetical protein